MAEPWKARQDASKRAQAAIAPAAGSGDAVGATGGSGTPPEAPLPSPLPGPPILDGIQPVAAPIPRDDGPDGDVENDAGTVDVPDDADPEGADVELLDDELGDLAA